MLLIGIILLGVSQGVKIEELSPGIFLDFYSGVSIVTLFLAILCGYIYYMFEKTGPLGPQGFQGGGRKGRQECVIRICCRGYKNLGIMVEKLIEKHNKAPVKSEIKNLICGYITLTTNPKVSDTPERMGFT